MAHKLAVIVPYRNREEHLKKFITHITFHLSNISHSLFIIEQTMTYNFNRGKLLNIGFDLSNENHDYFCFHDVDMLPYDVDYSYCENPTHLAYNATQNESQRKEDYFGGVCLFNKRDFLKINGFSNEYWGWGFEDLDLRRRCVLHNLNITHRKIGWHQSLDHKPSYLNEAGDVLETARINEKKYFAGSDNSGLNNLTYKILKQNNTHYLVEI